MAIRGAESKQYVIDKILQTFEGSFLIGGKELRIPLEEGGEPIQIKVALTAAKNIVEPDGDSNSAFVVKRESKIVSQTQTMNWDNAEPQPTAYIPPSAEEKQRVADYLKIVNNL